MRTITCDVCGKVPERFKVVSFAVRMDGVVPPREDLPTLKQKDTCHSCARKFINSWNALGELPRIVFYDPTTGRRLKA